MPDKPKIPTPVKIIKCLDAEAQEIERKWGYMVRCHDPANMYTLERATEIAVELAARGTVVGIFRLHSEVTKDGKK